MDFNSVHQKLKSKAGKTKDHPTVRTARAEHKRTPIFSTISLSFGLSWLLASTWSKLAVPSRKSKGALHVTISANL